MSFKENDCQQLTLNDAVWGLTERENRMLQKSWATHFADKIFPLIDENKYKEIKPHGVALYLPFQLC